VSDVQIPTDRRYTAEHEWVQRIGDTTICVGITDFAQTQLGDVVFVQLPEVGAEHSLGVALGEIESTKSVSDVFAPVAGTVQARNEALEDDASVLNSDPYGAGWLVELMLDAQAYRALTAQG